MKNATTMILMAILAMGLALVLGGCGGDQEAETPKAADVEQAVEEAVEQAGSAEAEKAVEEIGGFDKVNGLVLDLRNNPGGLLDQAVTVTDTFLDDGMIVYIQGRSEKSRKDFFADET